MVVGRILLDVGSPWEGRAVGKIASHSLRAICGHEKAEASFVGGVLLSLKISNGS